MIRPQDQTYVSARFRATRRRPRRFARGGVVKPMAAAATCTTGAPNIVFVQRRTLSVADVQSVIDQARRSA